MKKIFTFFVFCFALASLTFAQNNNSTGGTNYYSSLIGKTLPALGASGENALVFVDMAFANDGVVNSLTANGYNVTVASGASDFDTKMQSGNYDLVVLFVQNMLAADYGLSLTAISNYIANGKKMIFATWAVNIYSGLNDNAYAALFDAYFSGSTNLTTVTVTDPTMASGITNPFTLTGLGWGIFSVGLHAMNGATVLGTFENGDAAIVLGHRGNTVMLGYLSDATPVGERQAIFSNVSNAAVTHPVPVPYFWIILAFAFIAASVVFAKRKTIVA